MTVYRVTEDNNIIRVSRRSSTIKVLNSSRGASGAPGLMQSVVAGDNISVDNTDPANPVVSADLSDYATLEDLDEKKNYTGQVKANYTGLTLVDFDSGVNRVFPIETVTPTLSSPPTTIWPVDDGNMYDPYFYDVDNTRLKENARNGQLHTWRVIGNYTNKASGNNGALAIELFNPDSGFVVTSTVTLPTGLTQGEYTANFFSIADGASIPDGSGYRLRARTSFSDNNLTVSITSITRISYAMEHSN